MPVRTAVVASTSGLHARPAQLLVGAVREAGLPIRIRVGDKPAVDAASILSVMAMGAGYGDEVTIEADGAGAEAALDRIAGLLATNLDA
jgi:phosphocarrier protein